MSLAVYQKGTVIGKYTRLYLQLTLAELGEFMQSGDEKKVIICSSGAFGILV